MMEKKILVTGASGFIGSSVIDKAIEKGYETWAGIRISSNKKYLQHPNIHFMDLKYQNKETLKTQLSDYIDKHGRFHFIVHAAGLTKARSKDDFEKVNFTQTKHFIDTLIELNAVPDLFIFISTLGVMGIGDEKSYAPFPVDCQPNPNTLYGKSKLKAEQYIKGLPCFPYVILRPTGVYGPRDKDYLILMRAVKNGLNVGAGFRKQLLTFIFIDDLVDIIFRCIENNISRREYYVSDGYAYTDTEFNTIVQDALKRKSVVRLKIPLLIVRVAAFLNEAINRMLGRATTFNTDKYHIMRQRNWTCDVSPLKTELGFVPRFPLKKGVEKTIEWYKNEGWL